MVDSLQKIIIANLLISLISLVGVVLIPGKSRSEKLIYCLVSFAAGVMLAAVFFHILPEAIEMAEPKLILSMVLVGIVLSFFMERFLLWYHHHHEDSHEINPTAYLVIVGDTIHNFLDGIAVASAFLVNPAVGWASTLAIMTHEIPQEIADFSILVHSGMSRKKALMTNLFSGITAVIGGIFGYFFFANFTDLIPLALAISGGMFIYIASADLIPELHRNHREQSVLTQALPFIAGIMLMWFVTNIATESQTGPIIESPTSGAEVIID